MSMLGLPGSTVRPRRLVLVNGPSQDRCDRFFGWPTSLLQAVAPTVLAIRSGELPLELRDKLFDPVWYSEGQNGEEILSSWVDMIQPEDVICGSATYDSLYPTLKLFEVAKLRYPTVTTVLGGPHADETHTSHLLNDARALPHVVDFLVAGDGEYALLGLLRNLLREEDPATDFDCLPGLAWCYSGSRSWTTSGRRLELDSLPTMPIELADGGRHQNDFDVFREQDRIIPTIQMIAGRGCPYSCTYCSERSDLASPAARSVEGIMREIELRKQGGFGAVFFDDSTFGAYPHRPELLRELRSSGLAYGCLNRFNHLTNPAIVEQYALAGFRYIYCAIEQYDDAILRGVSKGLATRAVSRAMHALRESGISLGVSLLYGLPGETKRSVLRTLEFVGEWVDAGVIRLVSESVLSFHPGTPAGWGRPLDYRRTPPNPGFPFDRFEEGQWYHHSYVTPEYLCWIQGEAEARFSHALVRNRHSWYRRAGFLAVTPHVANASIA